MGRKVWKCVCIRYTVLEFSGKNICLLCACVGGEVFTNRLNGGGSRVGFYVSVLEYRDLWAWILGR